MPSLSINPAANPFPFAALVTAAYLNVPVAFDDNQKDITLQGSSSRSDELEIVKILSKSAGAYADDPKVFDF